MPTPTSKGQYRRVRYTDDGCGIYQCLWCLGTVEIRDNPQYGWNFCPLCGKSWFSKLECRDHYTPRWFYDRYGNHGPLDVPMYPQRKPPTHEWYIEKRHRWNDSDEWSDWDYEFDYKHEKLGDHKWVYQILNLKRLESKDSAYFQYEFRVSLRKII